MANAVAPRPAEEVDEEEEQTVGRALKAPQRPSVDEVDAHEASGHLPFRNWCRACIVGRGREDPSTDKKKVRIAGVEVPVISMDYGYLGDRPARGPGGAAVVDPMLMPILAVKDQQSKAVLSVPCEAKGLSNNVAKMVAEWIVFLGHSRVIVKGDQEPALRSVQQEVLKLLKEKGVQQAAPELSPSGHSQANGAAEQAVGAIQGQSRTLLAATEAKLGQKLSPKDAALAWLVAGQL